MSAPNFPSPEPALISFELLANIAANAEGLPCDDGFHHSLPFAFEGERLVGYGALKQERHRF